MLNKNQVYEAVITDYTSEGQGVAHIEGCAVFIPNAIAGEKVLVRIEKAQKTWAAGKITEILEKSPHRCNRECGVAKLCGGCDFWHMDYEEETRLKAERVRNCLNRLGGENLEEVPILSAPTCYGYRNKAQYPVAVKKNRAYAGFFRAGTHDVVENKRCLMPSKTRLWIMSTNSVSASTTRQPTRACCGTSMSAVVWSPDRCWCVWCATAANFPKWRSC